MTTPPKPDHEKRPFRFKLEGPFLRVSTMLLITPISPNFKGLKCSVFGRFRALQSRNIYGKMKIEYVGNEKSTVPLKIDISADYDNGYVFDGDAVYMGYREADDESWHWKYDDTIEFEPLSSSTTRILRYCVEVPEQVETNADKALLVTISVNDEPFVFDFRSADVLGSDYDPRAEFYQPVDDETKQQIVAYLKANGLKEMGWYEQNVNYFEFTFDDENVYARMPLASNPDYGYDFNGTYEVFAKTILITWDYGTQMHLDYTFDGNSLTVTEFDYNR